jgi:signal peptide peptidase SppA
MTNLPHLAQRLFNTPLAIAPGKLEVVMAALADRFGIAKIFRMNGESLAFDDEDDWGFQDEGKDWTPYEVVDGIACVPVTGTLVHKLGHLNPYSGMMGYDSIRAQVGMALADKDVRAIVLDVDTPGGEVSGCFDLVDDIYHARGTKPIWSILSEKAFSAGYAIASAADKVIVPRTGGTGSVGVICAVVDFSRALDAAGITVELITYGAHKADGNEFNPLTKAARDRFQADVDAMGELFVETTARNRKMTSAKVRATQALTYMGAAGVEVGFADAVMSPQQALAALRKELR